MTLKFILNEIKYLALRLLKFFIKLPNLPTKIVSYKDKRVADNFYVHRTSLNDFKIFEIRNANIWGNNGTVIVQNKYYITEINRKLPSSRRNPIFYQHSLITPNHIKGTVALVASIAGNVFYHWMIDILPRLIELQNYENYNKIDFFIINKISNQFQIDTIAKLGIPQAKIIEVNNLFDHHFNVDLLIFPSFTSQFNKSSLLTIKHLQNAFGLNNSLRINFSQYIFISRRGGNNRILLQEEEIYSVLKTKGFERFYAEDYTIQNQINLFKNAKVIIGPHGSGFTNIVFCKPQTIIIDICAPEWINDCFKSICELNHLYYHRIIGIKHQFHKKNEIKNADILLDLQNFITILEQIIVE